MVNRIHHQLTIRSHSPSVNQPQLKNPWLVATPAQPRRTPLGPDRMWWQALLERHLHAVPYELRGTASCLPGPGIVQKQKWVVMVVGYGWLYNG